MSDELRDEDKWCFAWFADEDETQAQTRAALQKDAKWQSGDVISIAFLDGTDQQKALVKQYSKEWVDGLANLNFSWVDDPDESDIRISFKYKGSWSVIGTTCKRVAKSDATMNFGWLGSDVSAPEAKRVILHEFGHALGMIHEHQNPFGGIKWNKPAVFDDLSKPPNNWDRATIERNMFKPYSTKEINGTKLDAQSIMLYPIPASWTTNGFSAGSNKVLSPTDRAFIRQQYQ